MPYITSIERFGIEKGEIKTLQESVSEIIELRFLDLPFAVREKVLTTSNIEQLKAWRKLAVTCASLEEFRKHLGL